MDFLEAIYNAIVGVFEFFGLIISVLLKLVGFFIALIEMVINAFL